MNRQDDNTIRTRKQLARLVSDTTVDVYEALAPQLAARIEQTKKRRDLTEAQQSDEVLLDMMGYVKSCTNEILIEVLSRMLKLPEEENTAPAKIRR